MILDLPVLAVLSISASYIALRPGPWGARLRQTWILAMLLGSASTIAAWARRGGWSNNFMTTYFFAIVPAFVGMRRLEASSPDRPITQWFGPASLAMQLAWLGYNPLSQIPTSADYAAGRTLVATLRATPGPVLVPEHPWLAVLAGMEPSYQANAYWELGFIRPARAPIVLLAGRARRQLRVRSILGSSGKGPGVVHGATHRRAPRALHI